MGTLFLVATPIGNLEDLTLRALRVLREVRLIAAEDTRHTRTLLDRYAIATPCISYHEHNKLTRQADILAALALGDVALVSDAGTPALADPGFELVRASIEAGFTVSPIPGPSALLAALVASGLPSDRFVYVGFLPRQANERRALVSAMADFTMTLVCFETPHRLRESLADLLSILGDRRVVVASELTKRFEELRRGSLSELVAYFDAHNPRGEYTLVLEGRPVGQRKRDRTKLQAAPADSVAPSEAEIAQRLRLLREQGQPGSAAARIVARELGLQKSQVYALWLRLDQL